MVDRVIVKIEKEEKRGSGRGADRVVAICRRENK